MLAEIVERRPDHQSLYPSLERVIALDGDYLHSIPGDSLAYQLLSRGEQLFAHYMGRGYIDHDGLAKTVGSDRPSAHKAEAKEMESILDYYLTSEKGEEFLHYVRQNGRRFMDLLPGAADLPDGVVAAVIHDGKNNGLLVGNYNHGKSFEDRVRAMANQYLPQLQQIPYFKDLTAGELSEALKEYAIVHELSHGTKIFTEQGAENFVSGFYLNRSGRAAPESRRRKLARAMYTIAASREAQAKKAGK